MKEYVNALMKTIQFYIESKYLNNIFHLQKI